MSSWYTKHTHTHKHTHTYFPSASLALAYCRWILGEETWGSSSPTLALEDQSNEFMIRETGPESQRECRQ